MFLYALLQYIFASLPNPAIPLALESMHIEAETRAAVLADETRLNLNTASREELMTLPGIGAVTADAILALREDIGVFHYPEELLLVHGIGAKKLESIYDLICTEASN